MLGYRFVSVLYLCTQGYLMTCTCSDWSVCCTCVTGSINDMFMQWLVNVLYLCDRGPVGARRVPWWRGSDWSVCLVDFVLWRVLWEFFPLTPTDTDSYFYSAVSSQHLLSSSLQRDRCSLCQGSYSRSVCPLKKTQVVHQFSTELHWNHSKNTCIKIYLYAKQILVSTLKTYKYYT